MALLKSYKFFKYILVVWFFICMFADLMKKLPTKTSLERGVISFKEALEVHTHKQEGYHLDNEHHFVSEANPIMVDLKGVSLIKVNFFGTNPEYITESMSRNVSNFVILNPYVKKQYLIQTIRKLEVSTGFKPLSEEEFETIVRKILQARRDGTLKSIPNRISRKAISLKKCARGEYEKAKRENNKIKLYKVIETWDFKKRKKMSISKLAKRMKLSERTMKRYFSQDKNYRILVDSINEASADLIEVSAIELIPTTNGNLTTFTFGDEVITIMVIPSGLPQGDKVLDDKPPDEINKLVPF